MLFNHRAKRGGSLSGLAFGGAGTGAPVRGFAQGKSLSFWAKWLKLLGHGVWTHTQGLYTFCGVWPPGGQDIKRGR